jgi:probable phosphoglycerate mutase
MATLFLIRHGLTAQTGRILYGRAPGVGLDGRGRAQAERLAERFRPIRLTAIYSSPLERCVQTVEPLAVAQRLPILESEPLVEMDAGRWTNRRLATLRRRAAWETVQRAPGSFRFPGGESFPEAMQRAVTEVERIARRHRRGRVAVATHGDIVRILLCHFLGAPLDRFQRSVIDTASVTVIETDGRVTRVLLANDTGAGLERFAPGRTESPWDADGNRARGNLRG